MNSIDLKIRRYSCGVQIFSDLKIHRSQSIACVESKYTREAKRCYRECTTPPGFVEVARSRNLELIRRRYIIHDTIGRSAGPGRTPRLRLAFYIMRASIFFSEVSGRQPSGRLFFARTSCLDAREARSASPFLSSYHFEDRILDKSIHVPCHSEEREKEKERQGERKREREREGGGGKEEEEDLKCKYLMAIFFPL